MRGLLPLEPSQNKHVKSPVHISPSYLCEICRGQPKLDLASHWAKGPFPVQSSCEELHGGLVLPLPVGILAKGELFIPLRLICLILRCLLQCRTQVWDCMMTQACGIGNAISALVEQWHISGTQEMRLGC